MNKAYKFRIYPNNDQKILMEKTFGCTRFIYNKMLEDKINYYQQEKKMLKVTPAMYKQDYLWLKEVDSLALANVQLNLEKAYKSFFRTPSIGFPKFKSKRKSRASYTSNYVNNNIKLETKHIVLPKLGPIKIMKHRSIPEDYRLKSVTVSKTPTEKYYVGILYEYHKEIEQVKIENSLGLDYTMHGLYKDSNNEDGNYPSYYQASLKKLQRASRELSRCQKGSKNREKKRMKVAKLHEKVSNQRKDFLHKRSRQITNVNDAVIVENLNMKEMSAEMKFGKSVMDNGYGIFLSMLEYKLKGEGKTLIKIDKWYPSSKTCSQCGHVKESLLLSERIYKCSACDSVIDRDYNASINIKKEGLRQVVA